MPSGKSRILPISIIAILACLVKCRDKRKRTTTLGEIAIPDSIWLKLTDTDPQNFLCRMLAAQSALARAEAAAGDASKLFQAKVEKLTTYCADFHVVLDRGIAREAFAPGARAYYLRDLHATSIPNPTTHDALKIVAQNIVKGEADRAAAEGEGQPLTMDSGLRLDEGHRMDATVGGYRAMDLPSADEVADVLAEFEEARQDAEDTHTAFNLAQEALMAFKAEGKELCRDVYDEVEHFHRKDPDASSRRDKCEPWGLTYGDGDAPPEEPENPTPPAPTPPNT